MVELKLNISCISKYVFMYRLEYYNLAVITNMEEGNQNM